MEDICMEQLSGDGKKIEDTLAQGKLVVVRSGDGFLYFLEDGDYYRMFSHTAGQTQAGRRMQPKGSNCSAMFEELAKTSDAMFAATFDPQMDIPSVLYQAEDAILEAFPMKGEPEKIDFTAPAPDSAPEG